MAAQYHSIFTEQGLALLREAIQNGTKLGITEMSFGDGAGIVPEPDATFVSLVNEIYKTQLNRLAPSANNPNWLEADAVIPSAVGGFNIREVGLWAGNVLVAYSNYPPTYKPSADQGTAQIKTIRIVLQIDNTANFELKIDASVVMATIQAVEEAKSELNTKISETDMLLKKINENYVYASLYGKTLNEAFERINIEFHGQNIHVIVPPNMGITDTIYIGVDCHIEMSSLNVLNDIGTIFDPMDYWNGSTTEVKINCKNYACKTGWNFKKPLGIVTLQKCEFRNVGNEKLATSHDQWCAFYIGLKDIKNLTLHNPTSIDCYVNPNSVIGDAIGPCRNIILEDNVKVADPVANIYIYNPVAINLKTIEDADAIVINIGTNSEKDVMLNVNIQNCEIIDVSKRAFKIIGKAGLYTKGIHLSGNMSIKNQVKYNDIGYAAVDISGDILVDWHGSLYGTGYILGMNIQNGAILTGELSAHFDMTNESVLNGNQIRALNQTGTATQVKIKKLSGKGGAELQRLDQTHFFSGEIEHESYNRSTSLAGSFDIPKATFRYKDTNVQIEKSDYLISISGTDDVKRKIKNIDIQSSVSIPIKYALNCITARNLDLDDIVVNGAFTTSALYFRQVENVRIKKARSNIGSYLTRIENGAKNVIFDQCYHPTSLKTVISGEITNLVEKDTQTF